MTTTCAVRWKSRRGGCARLRCFSQICQSLTQQPLLPCCAAWGRAARHARLVRRAGRTDVQLAAGPAQPPAAAGVGRAAGAARRRRRARQNLGGAQHPQDWNEQTSTLHDVLSSQQLPCAPARLQLVMSLTRTSSADQPWPGREQAFSCFHESAFVTFQVPPTRKVALDMLEEAVRTYPPQKFAIHAVGECAL